MDTDADVCRIQVVPVGKDRAIHDQAITGTQLRKSSNKTRVTFGLTDRSVMEYRVYSYGTSPLTITYRR